MLINRIILLILIFTFIKQLPATGLITNTGNRTTYSLNGKWQFIVDPAVQNERRHIQFSETIMEKSKLWEHSFSTTKLLEVPGDWNSQDDKLFYYEGSVWYKKEFDYDRKSDKRLFVYFGGANYRTEVYLNTKTLGEHVGGFTPFQFEVTDIVNAKNNSLIVNVDNRHQQEDVPTIKTDWWNYGGLTREVKLIETPKIFIKDYYLQLQKGSKTDVTGWIYLDGIGESQTVTIRIDELDIAEKIEVKLNQKIKLKFKIEPELWSPENPKLYKVVFETEFEKLPDLIGFRTIETKGENIILNGKSVFLRGINMHEEKPYGHGRMATMDEAIIMFTRAKELGSNFVRLAHYPHNENMVRLADKMGFMIWSEIPVWQRIKFENDATKALAQNLMSEMITRDKNRASIIIWSLANETPVKHPDRLSFLLALRKTVLELDSTRLIGAALNKMDAGKNKYNINDPLGKYLDIIGINEYVGWYTKELSPICEEYVWETEFEKPHIISEFGGGALYGFHGDILTRWTEEFQEELYKNQIKMFKKVSFLRAVSPWILKDFRSSQRMLSGIQDGWNRKGLMSERGEKKKAYYIMQRYYQELKEKYNNK